MSSNSGANGQSGTVNFAAEIFNAITHTQTSDSTGNVIVSPLLLEAVLSLLYLGSDGLTAEQLRQKLQLQRFGSDAKVANYYATLLAAVTKPEADTKLHLVSEILLGHQMLVAEEFEKIARKYFHTSTASVKQEAAATATADNGETTAASNSVPARTLTVAELKFKWFLPFSAYRSGIYDFHNEPSAEETPTITLPTGTPATTAKPVAMLFDDDMFVKFGEFRELDARAIELPLDHELELSMLLLLPNQRNGLAALEQQLPQLNLAELTEQRMQVERVQVLMPKFHIDFECDMRAAVQKLGIGTIFNEGANFKNLFQLKSDKDVGIHFMELRHKVRIDVHESGSVSSNIAVNKPIVISNSINGKQKFFRADHPFYFVIRSGAATYFAGHVKTL